MNTGTTLNRTYILDVGQSAAEPGIQSVVGSSIRDLAGNESGDTAPGTVTLPVRTAARR